MRALVTGVGSGLGEAVARELLARGWDVVAMSRRCRIEHRHLTFVEADLADHAAIPGKTAGLGGFDLAVLNAGVFGGLKDLKDIPLDEAKTVFDVNVWANKVLIDALLREGAQGHIVGISSGAAKMGSGGWGPYSMSKAALNVLFKVYAYEHPATHFTALAPGVIQTPMIDMLLAHPDEPRWPALARIRSYVGTENLMTPAFAAKRLLDAVPKARAAESGAFLDVRNL